MADELPKLDRARLASAPRRLRQERANHSHTTRKPTL